MRLRHHVSHLSLGRRVAIRSLIAFLITLALMRILTAIMRYASSRTVPFASS